MIVSASWCFGTGSASNNRRHPVELMMDELTGGGPSVSSFDLRSLKAGYHLRVTDDTQPTWLPNISRKDFIRNVPRGRYLSLSPTFKQLPPGTEVVALPYWVLLVWIRKMPVHKDSRRCRSKRVMSSRQLCILARGCTSRGRN